MKKILLLLVVYLTTTSCYTIYQVIPNSQNYTENINFSIDKVEEGKAISTGNGSYNASRGYKFVFVFLTFKNNTEQKQELDFDNFLLLNSRTKTKHKPEWSMVTGPINMFGKIDSYINKESEKKRKLVYIFPEEDKADLLMVNDAVVKIEYTK